MNIPHVGERFSFDEDWLADVDAQATLGTSARPPVPALPGHVVVVMNLEDEMKIVLVDANLFCRARIGNHLVHLMACMLPSSGSGGDEDPCPIISHHKNKVVRMVFAPKSWVIMAKTSAASTKPRCFCCPFLSHKLLPREVINVGRESVF